MTTVSPSVSPAGGAVVGVLVALLLTPFLTALGDGDAAPTDLFLVRYVGDEPPETYVTPGTALHLWYGAVAGAALATLEPNHFVDWPKYDPLWESLRRGVENGAVFGALLSLVAAVGLRILLGLQLTPRRVGAAVAFNLGFGVAVGAVFGLWLH